MNDVNESIDRKNAARLVFVQALYGEHFGVPIKSAEGWVDGYKQDLLSDDKVDDLERDERSDEVFQLKTETKPDMSFLRKLLRGWLEEKAAVEYQLSMQLDADKHRGYSRLSPLVQSLLCAAVFELVHTKTKNPVILKEYMDIAGGFFDNPELGFINGVLQEVADSVQ